MLEWSALDFLQERSEKSEGVVGAGEEPQQRVAEAQVWVQPGPGKFWSKGEEARVLSPDSSFVETSCIFLLVGPLVITFHG